MKKVGICGHFGADKLFIDGQTIKTKTIFFQLKKHFGDSQIIKADTFDWKHNVTEHLRQNSRLIKECENVIIMPARGGVKVLVPFFAALNRIYHRRLHYIVIGGWLPGFIKDKPYLLRALKKFDFIYVETHSMKKALEKCGLSNICIMPNFKDLDILSKDQLVYSNTEPYKLCTFSRVMQEKGIEDAVDAVKTANAALGRTAFTLDIYGQIDKDYEHRFNVLQKDFPDFISYKGLTDPSDSVSILKEYTALLFPTYYYGEGFAGTLLDALAAGVPSIASDWKYNEEIIKNNQTGLIFRTRNQKELTEKLLWMNENIEQFNLMKENCLDCAKKYTPDKAVKILIENLN